jgi:hypothetical protein
VQQEVHGPRGPVRGHRACAEQRQYPLGQAEVGRPGWPVRPARTAPGRAARKRCRCRAREP